MEKLTDLTPPELILLQKHIELGKDHLEEILGKRGLEEFLQYAKPNQATIDQIKADDTEASGNFIHTVNTIITGTFGGWMGFSAMMELNLSSPFMFGSVLALATFVGLSIGYESFLATKEEAIEAFHTLQSLQIVLEILKEIYRKRTKELLEIQENICASVIALCPSKATASISQCILALNHVIDEKISSYESKPVYHFLKEKIDAIKARMKKNLEEGSKDASLPRDDDRNRELPSLIARLICAYPREAKTSQSWISKDARKMFISLIPTLFGGFGSLFVYLSGSTEIAQAFEYESLVVFLTSHAAKLTKIAISVLVTLYFGFSFLYSYRKTYRRNVEIEKNKEAIVKEETSLTLLDAQLFKFRQVREDAEKIREIFSMADEDWVAGKA